MRLPEQPTPDMGIPLRTPYRHLFDFVVDALRNDPDGDYACVANTFDPRLVPAEDLPGGK